MPAWLLNVREAYRISIVPVSGIGGAFKSLPRVSAAAESEESGAVTRRTTRTNIWDYGGVNSFRSERTDELQLHPTVKPAGMMADAIRGLLVWRRPRLIGALRKKHVALDNALEDSL